MFGKNNFYFKATHYFLNKNYIYIFNKKMQLSNIKVNCETNSATADSAKQGFLFRLSINT